MTNPHLIPTYVPCTGRWGIDIDRCIIKALPLGGVIKSMLKSANVLNLAKIKTSMHLPELTFLVVVVRALAHNVMCCYC